MKKNTLTILSLCIALLVIFLSCHASVKDDTVGGRTIPAIGELEKRIKSLYKAGKYHDWRTWYELSTWSVKKEFSFDEFLSSFVGDGKESLNIISCISAKILTIREVPTPKNQRNVNAATAVAMDVLYKKIQSELEVRPKDQTDYWFYMDGKWYWTWRGWPYD